MAGRFIPIGEIYFGARVGEVKTKNGTIYEMHIRSGDRTPVVVNRQNGRKFHLDWDEILLQAMEAGIANATGDERDEKCDESTCTCGHRRYCHFNAGERNICSGGGTSGNDENRCQCDGFEKKITA